MPNLLSHRQLFARSLAALALVALGAGLSGCAGMSDTISPAFADPAKYDLYDCKQLEPERKSLAARTAELQGLMTKAETGVAGSVVAEMAYRNDYIAVRGQSKLAEEAWQKNRCQDAKPEARPAPKRLPPAPSIRTSSGCWPTTPAGRWRRSAWCWLSPGSAPSWWTTSTPRSISAHSSPICFSWTRF
jgi:hypothetical protein